MLKLNLFLVIAIISILNLTAYSTQSSDSLFVGRKCKIILSYGFEAEGNITRLNTDTVWLKTQYKELGIPIKDIKFVVDPGTEPKELEPELVAIENQKVDTTDDCDVYLSSKSTLKDVELFYESDTTLIAIKEQTTRRLNIKDIRKIVFKPSSPFWKGFLFGAGVGFLVGFVPFAFTKGGGHPDISGPRVGFIVGLVLAVPCGLIGGLVGVLTSSNDVYSFDRGITTAKVKRIKYIIQKHS